MVISKNAVYTPHEAQQILKISPSTFSRLVKGGCIRVAKVGKQYRILGKEILRIVSPQLEDHVGKVYNKARRWAHIDDQISAMEAP